MALLGVDSDVETSQMTKMKTIEHVTNARSIRL